MLLAANGRFERWSQLIDATHALKRSAGVSYPSVIRGRSLSCLATALSFAWLCIDKSVPFGKYCRSRRLVFSFVPRCQGECGSHKKTSIFVAKVNFLCPAISDPRSQVSERYSFLGSLIAFVGVNPMFRNTHAFAQLFHHCLYPLLRH